MTKKHGLPVIVLLLAACSLVACDYSHHRTFLKASYRPTLFNYAAGGRDLALETIGNPFAGRGVDDQEFPDFIAASMQGHNWGQPTNFTTTPGPTARPQYKVVIAFNPVEPATYRALCEGAVETGPTEGNVRVKAAFCERAPTSGERVLTGVRADIVAEAGPDSDAFQSLMAGVTRDLFPLFNDDLDDDDCSPHRLICP